MNFHILSTNFKDTVKWHKILNSFPPEKRDIHYLPEYGKIFKKSHKYIPKLAVYENSQGIVIHSFVEKRIDDLDMFSNIKDNIFDVSNPYGYGGPICNSNNAKIQKDLLNKFWKNWNIYCKKSGYISEFVSFHPLYLDQTNIPTYNVKNQKKIIYIDLNKNQNDIIKDINRGCKSNISHAQKNKVIIKKVPSSKSNILKFNKIYKETMNRKNASNRWMFPNDFFYFTIKYLGKENTKLFFAYKEDKVIAVNLLIHDKNTVYYHFGGSKAKYNNLRPNNLLMYEEIMWAKNNGFKYFHLGGGVSNQNDDSILRYKQGFSKSFKMLKTYRKIHNRNYYASLKDIYFKKNKKIENNDYFPIYRR